MRIPHGPGFGAFGGIVESIIAGLFFILCFLIVVGLLVVLVRFLWVATKAAEIYIAKNSRIEPVPPVAESPEPVESPATPITTPTTTPTRTRSRTPKPPAVS
jgi:hypothetical protein